MKSKHMHSLVFYLSNEIKIYIFRTYTFVEYVKLSLNQSDEYKIYIYVIKTTIMTQ